MSWSATGVRSSTGCFRWPRASICRCPAATRPPTARWWTPSPVARCRQPRPSGPRRALAELARRTTAAHRPGATFDVDAHHGLAREAARRSIVLLRNDLNGQAVLPLRPDTSVAVIGEFARTPRYQGGGSSHVTSTRLDVPIDEIRARAGGAVVFCAGYTTDGSGDATELRDEAVRAAAAADADAAVLFLGLDESQESEGFDRTDIDVSANTTGGVGGRRGRSAAHGRGARARWRYCGWRR